MPIKESVRCRRYFELGKEFPLMSKRERLLEAGYSKYTKSDVVERGAYYKYLEGEFNNLCDSLALDIENRILRAQKVSGACVVENLRAAQKILKDKGSKDNDKLTAIQRITDITGEKMPEQVIANIDMDDELLNKLLGREKG